MLVDHCKALSQGFGNGNVSDESSVHLGQHTIPRMENTNSKPSYTNLQHLSLVVPLLFGSYNFPLDGECVCLFFCFFAFFWVGESRDRKKNPDHYRKSIHAIKVELSGFMIYLDYLGQGQMDG